MWPEGFHHYQAGLPDRLGISAPQASSLHRADNCHCSCPSRQKVDLINADNSIDDNSNNNKGGPDLQSADQGSKLVLRCTQIAL